MTDDHGTPGDRLHLPDDLFAIGPALGPGDLEPTPGPQCDAPGTERTAASGPGQDDRVPAGEGRDVTSAVPDDAGPAPGTGAVVAAAAPGAAHVGPVPAAGDPGGDRPAGVDADAGAAIEIGAGADAEVDAPAVLTTEELDALLGDDRYQPAAPAAAPAAGAAVDPRPRRRGGRHLAGRGPARRPGRSALRAVAPVLLVALVAVALKTFVISSFVIPSESMLPTLEVDDRILVDKTSPARGGITVGDIVVFRTDPESHSGFDFLVKRVVGLPGDQLDEQDGRLVRNGEPVDEPYLYPGTVTRISRPITVPAGHVFVMGDNRAASSDSRVFGPVPESRLVGEVVVTFWPFDRVNVPD